MACLTTAERAYIEAQLAIKQAQLTAANIALTAIIDEINESYKFDSGEGAQQAKLRKFEEYTKLIALLEAQIKRLYTRLKCQTLVNINIRRKYR